MCVHTPSITLVAGLAFGAVVGWCMRTITHRCAQDNHRAEVTIRK